MATMKFRGPKLTGPAYERFRMLGFRDETSLEYCSNCKNCDISCPSGVPVATLNMLARAVYCRERNPPLRDWMLAHADDLGKLCDYVPGRLINFCMGNYFSRLLLHAFGIEKRAPLPRFAPLAQRRAFAEKGNTRAGKKTVAFFPDCFTRYYDPATGLDCIRLLEKAGYTVVAPKAFVCCGLPLVTGGYADDARRKARLNSKELAFWSGQGVPVLTACPSCALMLQHEYRTLFSEDEDLGNHAGRVIDICAFIAALIRAGTLGLSAAPHGMAKLAYHAPCHARAQGAGRAGLDLLSMIPGMEIADMDSGCCGIAGSYGFKRGTYAIGMRVGASLFTALKEHGAPLVASECGTCRVQIRHGSGIDVAHPISIVLHSLK
jgi:glycerol-3-phosphate dehydrogenase subunit C